jgi:hypothetical protein
VLGGAGTGCDDGEVPEDFVIARNPETESTLPYLIRIPLGPQGIVLKARDTWPRTAKVYCHRADEWPPDAEIVERVPTRSCVRRGAAIDLVLDRGRESRSQFVLTHVRGGREAIFWQTGRTAKQARPRGALPKARASGLTDLMIVVDSHERYAWTFTEQQARTERRALPAGDYAVEIGDRVVAAVERKSLTDLVSTLTSGRLRYVLAELAALDHAAVVVEDRYSGILGLKHVRPAVVLDGLGECQARFPTVPVIFAETRALAQEWTFRFFGAALAGGEDESAAERRFADLVEAGPLAEPAPTTAQVRAWAREHGIPVPDRGRLRPEVWTAYLDR